MSEAAAACPYCGSEQARLECKKHHWPGMTEAFFDVRHDLYVCEDCDLRFCHPLSDDLLDGIGNFFKTRYHADRVNDLDRTLVNYWGTDIRSRLKRRLTYLRFLFRVTTGLGTLNRYEQVLKIVRQGRPRTLLDVGASHGLFLSMCLSAGMDGYGVEPSSEIVAALDAFNGGGRIAEGNFPETRGKLPTYDVITFIAVMICFAYPSRSFFATCRQALNERGRLIIHDYNPALASVDTLTHSVLGGPVWLSFYSPKFMQRVCRDVGFSSFEMFSDHLDGEKSIYVLTA